jgi:hypothetical protein
LLKAEQHARKGLRDFIQRQFHKVKNTCRLPDLGLATPYYLGNKQVSAQGLQLVSVELCALEKF